MKWKEFFKPTWEKLILLFLFFPILITIFGAISIIEGQGLAIGTYYDSISSAIGYPFFLLAPSTIGLTNFVANAIDLPFEILDYVYWYVVACVIIWIYYKVKKK